MTSTIQFTVIIINPTFNLWWRSTNSDHSEGCYWIDGRPLYDNLYFTETATMTSDQIRQYAKDFLYRTVRDYQYQRNIDAKHLEGHTLEWTWNGRCQAQDECYPSGKYAECMWIQEGKVYKQGLDPEVLERIERDMSHQSNTFYYGREYAEKMREEDDFRRTSEYLNIHQKSK